MLNNSSIRITLALILSLGIHGTLMGLDGNWFSLGYTSRTKSRRVSMTLAARRVSPQTGTPAVKNETPRAMAKKGGEPESTASAEARRAVQEATVRRKPEKMVKAVVQELPKPVEEPVTISLPDSDGESLHEEQNVEEQVFLKESFVEDRLPETGKAYLGLIPVREVRPLYKINPPPRYPAAARRRRHQGTVLLEVLVDSSGQVNEVRVYRSSGHKTLDSAALKAVGNWGFEPGKRGDQPVEMWVRVPVRFQLR